MRSGLGYFAIAVFSATFLAAPAGADQGGRPLQLHPMRTNLAAGPTPAQMLVMIEDLKQQVAALQQQHQADAQQMASMKLDVATVKLLITGLDSSLKAANQKVAAFKQEYENHHHQIGSEQNFYNDVALKDLNVHVDGSYYTLSSGYGDTLRLPLFAKGAFPLTTGKPQ